MDLYHVLSMSCGDLVLPVRALETRNYITADVIGHWYWHGKEGSSITRGVKHAFCSHFGSMAFAGLCVWFIEYLKRQARTRPSHPIACNISTFFCSYFSEVTVNCNGPV